VGTITEVLVWADEESKFFDPVPVNKPTNEEFKESESTEGMLGIFCQFGRFGST
jgi:hypothetical protein